MSVASSVSAQSMQSESEGSLNWAMSKYSPAVYENVTSPGLATSQNPQVAPDPMAFEGASPMDSRECFYNEAHHTHRCPLHSCKLDGDPERETRTTKQDTN